MTPIAEGRAQSLAAGADAQAAITKATRDKREEVSTQAQLAMACVRNLAPQG